MSGMRLRVDDVRVPADAEGVARGAPGEHAARGLAGRLAEGLAAHRRALAGAAVTPEGLAKRVAARVQAELGARGAGSAGGGP